MNFFIMFLTQYVHKFRIVIAEISPEDDKCYGFKDVASGQHKKKIVTSEKELFNFKTHYSL